MSEIDLGDISFGDFDPIGNKQQRTQSTDFSGRSETEGDDGIVHVLYRHHDRGPSRDKQHTGRARVASRPRPQLAHR